MIANGYELDRWEHKTVRYHLFLLIDTSERMSEKSIGIVNDATKDLIRIFSDALTPFEDALVSILTFGDRAEWTDGSPASMKGFEWRDLQTGGECRFGEALTELDRKLSGECPATTGSVILMSSGEPDDDWEAPLARLKGNGCFSESLTLALDFGDGNGIDVLGRFTGDPGQVLSVRSVSDLMNLRFLTVTSGPVGPQTAHRMSSDREDDDIGEF